MPFPKTYRTNAGWALSIGSILALFSNLQNEPRAVVSLAILGALGFLWSAWEHEWIRWNAKSIPKVVLILVTFFAITWFAWPPKVEQGSQVDTLFKAQLAELGQLEDFVGTKNESELQEVFGFQKLVEVNLWIQRSGRAPDKYTPGELNAINAYIRSSVNQADTRFGIYSDEGGKATFTANKGAVAAITLPREYLAGRATLAKFESSMTLPSTVRSALLELDQTITSNTSLLFDVFNEKVNENPDSLILYNDSQSKFFRAIPNIYWTRFIPLRPKIEKVLEATRTYLRVDQH